MVVNIVSLPSTVTFVTGAVRGRGCGKGTCAPATSGNTAAAHKTRQAICLKKLAKNMVAILIRPGHPAAASFDVGQAFSCISSPIYAIRRWK
jgi:hypothetical protein